MSQGPLPMVYDYQSSVNAEVRTFYHIVNAELVLDNSWIF